MIYQLFYASIHPLDSNSKIWGLNPHNTPIFQTKIVPKSTAFYMLPSTIPRQNPETWTKQENQMEKATYFLITNVKGGGARLSNIDKESSG